MIQKSTIQCTISYGAYGYLQSRVFLEVDSSGHVSIQKCCLTHLQGDGEVKGKDSEVITMAAI